VPSFAQALDLRDDPALIEEYRRHHRAVWPEVVESLRGIGITRMKIYLVGTRLFMYCEAREGFDPHRDFAAYAAHPRARAWDEWMRSFQRKLAEAGPADWWVPMDEVFDLEKATSPA
jgi:L-rhamnose mutarotase